MTATSTARRWLAAGLLALGAATLAAAPAAAQVVRAFTQNDSDPPKAPSILPQPNSGEKPRYQGAPGTASQYLAMGLTVGGVAMIALLIVRDSKKARARRDAAEADTRDA